jgi:hypothetical protein
MTKQQTQLTMDELNQVSGSWELQVTSFNPAFCRVDKSPNNVFVVDDYLDGPQKGRGHNGKYDHSNKPSQY